MSAINKTEEDKEEERESLGVRMCFISSGVREDFFL